MNVDAAPMTFDEVRKLAKQLEIPDFDVMELDKYKSLAKKYKEPANCIIWIPFEDGGSLGHYVTGTNRVFRVNKVKYQSIFANNCGYLALLHLYTHDAVDPAIQKL